MQLSEVDNYISATCPENRFATEKEILAEIREGNYEFGKQNVISALGAIPKPNSSEVRLIHDASRPYTKSLNSYAKLVQDATHYASLDQVVAKLQPNGWLAKVDLRHAYRCVPISPSNYSVTGLKWKFTGSKHYKYFYDTRLPFGAKRSPGIFQRITESVTRMLHRRGYKSVFVYLDDFIIVTDTEKRCWEAYQCLLGVLMRLGFTVNWNKVVEPSQNIIFLGVSIDSLSRKISIPQDKLIEIKDELKCWQLRKKATKRQLQQLIGKLNWAAKMLRTSRPFIRRIIDLSCIPKRPSHRVRIPAGVCEDLRWLLAICERFNGTVVIPEIAPQPDHVISTDASLEGGAAFQDGDWLYTHWISDYPNVASLHINLKELFVVLLACRRWYHKWKDKTIHLYTDNMATMYVINKGSMKNNIGMQFVREIFYLAAIYNFKLIAKYIKSGDNVIADAVSRLDNPVFALIAAECLIKWNILLLCHNFDYSPYMSLNSYRFVSQVLTKLSHDIWMQMC